MNNLITRALSGALYVAIIVACVLLSGWWLTGLLIALMTLAVAEFHHLLDDRAMPRQQRDMIMMMDIIGGAILILFSHYPLLLPVFLGYVVLRPVAQLFTSEGGMVRSLAVSYASMIYIALPLAAIQVLAWPWLVLSMFIMIWMNDTGAFLIGCWLGKHRLAPSISPKKSWEGFFGGAAFVIGSAFILKVIFPLASYDILLSLAGVVIVFGTFGDLVESKIKRSIGVKDSGNIIPGHGGILDRIDSLLLVAPAAVLVVYLIMLV